MDGGKPRLRGARMEGAPSSGTSRRLVTLRRGETRRFGVQFLVSKSIREIENTLTANARPVAVGIPGYVLPMDLAGDLWVSSRQSIHSIAAQPAEALEIAAAEGVQGWSRYRVTGKQWGRSTPDHHLCGWHAAGDSLLRHQAQRHRARRPGPIHFHEALVRRSIGSIQARSVVHDVRSRAQCRRVAGSAGSGWRG